MDEARKIAREVAVARSDLNILYGVVALLEGGTISAAHNRDVEGIVAICKAGAQRALRRYDDGMAILAERDQ